MSYKRYQHVERFGTQATDGIEYGECYVFYKVDGTNGSVWQENGEIFAGSRNRLLSLDKDNAGFYAMVLQNEKIKAYLEKHPTHRLFGEFLVPHSLRTYRDDAWKRFYVFDVTIDTGEGDEEIEYLHYNVYKEFLDEFGIDYVPPMAIVKNPNFEILLKLLEKTGQFLVKDGEGVGEGLVVKNYNYRNKYGRQIWGKVVCNEFREKQQKMMGALELNVDKLVEERIVEEFLTDAFIEKEFAKIVVENDGWQSKFIPMLLNKIFYELINEEMWNILKKYKNPKIDFKTLNAMVTQRIKEVKSDIFR